MGLHFDPILTLLCWRAVPKTQCRRRDLHLGHADCDGPWSAMGFIRLLGGALQWSCTAMVRRRVAEYSWYCRTVRQRVLVLKNRQAQAIGLSGSAGINVEYKRESRGRLSSICWWPIMLQCVRRARVIIGLSRAFSANNVPEIQGRSVESPWGGRPSLAPKGFQDP